MVAPAVQVLGCRRPLAAVTRTAHRPDGDTPNWQWDGRTVTRRTVSGTLRKRDGDMPDWSGTLQKGNTNTGIGWDKRDRDNS